MGKITNMKSGKHRIIIITGEVGDVADMLLNAAELDPELERQISIAALSLEYTRKSRYVGQQMADMILKPDNP
jgi:hypothetical protein